MLWKGKAFLLHYSDTCGVTGDETMLWKGKAFLLHYSDTCGVTGPVMKPYAVEG